MNMFKLDGHPIQKSKYGHAVLTVLPTGTRIEILPRLMSAWAG